MLAASLRCLLGATKMSVELHYISAIVISRFLARLDLTHWASINQTIKTKHIAQGRYAATVVRIEPTTLQLHGTQRCHYSTESAINGVPQNAMKTVVMSCVSKAVEEIKTD